MVEESRLSRRFYFVQQSSDHLYPVRNEDRETKRLAFRVWIGEHRKYNVLRVEETEMQHLGLEQGYSVRMTNQDGTRQGGFKLNGKSIVKDIKAI